MAKEIKLTLANGAIINATADLLKDNGTVVDVALCYKARGKENQVLLTYNKVNGRMADYSYSELKKTGLLKPVEKYIASQTTVNKKRKRKQA